MSVGRGTLGQVLQAAAGADCTLVSLGDSAAQPHGARLTGRQTRPRNEGQGLALGIAGTLGSEWSWACRVTGYSNRISPPGRTKYCS